MELSFVLPKLRCLKSLASFTKLWPPKYLRFSYRIIIHLKNLVSNYQKCERRIRFPITKRVTSEQRTPELWHRKNFTVSGSWYWNELVSDYQNIITLVTATGITFLNNLLQHIFPWDPFSLLSSHLFLVLASGLFIICNDIIQYWIVSYVETFRFLYSILVVFGSLN